MPEPEAFIIREVGGQGRRVQLVGAAIPEQGMSVGGKVRLQKTQYPGARGASVQVLGTEDDDLSVRGWLRDVWADEAGFAMRVRAEIDALRVGQAVVDVAWGTAVVKRAILREAKFTFTRTSDIQYELVFDVIESDDARALSREAPAADEEELLTVFEKTAELAEDARRVIGENDLSGRRGLLNPLGALVL